MRVLQLTYCTNQIKTMELPKKPGVAQNVWREIADDLLMGKKSEAEDLADGHVVRVSLYVVQDLDPNDPGSLELSVFRTCADIHPKEVEPKLYITKGAVA